MASITEIQGDLFTSGDPAYAHCVSRDLKMGAGIAPEFKRRYGRVHVLESQKKKVGQVAWVCVPTQEPEQPFRFVFYLVTKEIFHHKPRLQDIRSSLDDLRRVCKKYEVRELSIPRLACGKDKKEWDKDMLPMLHEVFREMPELQITVYRL